MKMTVSKYVRIAADLRSAIQKGDYSPGDTLPSGTELVNRYEVSRGTARQAIDMLAQEGLVTPIAGRGTVVRETAIAAMRYTAERPSPTWAESNEGDETARDQLVLAEWVGADYDIAQRLNVEVDDLVLHRLRYQFRGGNSAPVQLHDQWIPEAVVTAVHSHLDEQATGSNLVDPDALPRADLFALMKMAGFPLGQVTETIGARMPDPGERDALRLPVGVPVLTTHRVTVTEDGTPLETSDFVGAGDRCTNSFTVPLLNR
jgi:GntR family transcriptional regulator